jgi:hypothetical protein
MWAIVALIHHNEDKDHGGKWDEGWGSQITRILLYSPEWEVAV